MSQEQLLNDQEMEVTEHLGELRKRLIWSFLFFITFFVIGFIYVKQIYQYFTRNLTFDLVIISPGEALWIYLMIASIFAFTLTIPVICFQVWLFIKPALTPKERKITIAYIPAVFLLFVGGLCFGYFIIQEMVFNFLLSLSEGMFETMFTAGRYFRFLLQITLPFAFFFEIPIVSMFLTSLGFITPTKMKKVRKYAYFVLVIIGTMLSPPDFFLQLFVAAPLIVLYEVAIFTSEIAYRKKLRLEEEQITVE
ncbi:twin-arginine translocase subunit TatC [Salirhabdus salicampi]|uniref:twin-arginine translocase subunit TatC n=1 Tax=Salirhabdus salicampi TaxID=476102 RepID=UPI0020C39033|nr:twin-arginine translocase subunit TatC [Salirhabdus salicampi]MCP8616092.1 twin-arginine translocase subunit TatC [Salirhabdus salicampi]